MKRDVMASARPARRAAPPVPPQPEVLVNEALAHLQQERYEEAAQAAAQVSARAPGLAFARLVSGIALCKLGQHAQGIQELQYAAYLDPQDAQIRYNLAVTLQQAGQDDLAMLEYAACLERNPRFTDALWNYGEMLRLREHFTKALACFEQLVAIEGHPRDKLAHRMAVCSAALDLEAQADALFNAQIQSDDNPVSHWEYAHFLLARGRFTQAWPHYARRFEAGSQISLYRANYAYPFWNGELEAGATLLVHGEQGAGDEILFATFLPGLLEEASQSDMRVIVACRPGLVSLFQASFTQAEVVAHEIGQPADVRALTEGSQQTWQVMIGDLGRWLKKPAPAAYLTPQPADVDAMRTLLGDHPPGLRVGLAVSANPYSPQANRHQRNVNTALVNAHAAELQRNCPGVRFYSLHTAECRPALAALADVDVCDLSPYLTDFSRTAALMRQMDVVVSVCTSTANLAGALGCDTRVLLQRHADWRWCNDTAWYPQVKTYRQEIASDWSAPVRHLFAELAARRARAS